MSVAGFLEKLLDGAEVVWKPLGDIAQYSTTRIGSDQLNESNYVGVDNLLQNRAGRLDSNYVPSSGNFTEFQEGDVLIGNIRPYLRKIWHADRRGGTNGDVLVVHPTDSVLNSRYLFQVLTDENFFKYNIQHSKGAKMPRGSKPHILQYLVPIPCPDDPEKSLSIQGEIVRILDSFTELTAELTAELTQRKKQYNHYRDQLLTFNEDEVEWKTLGDVTLKSYSGATPKAGNPKYYTQGTIPWLRTQEVVFSDIHETNVKITQAAVDETAAKWVPENCVIIAISGATAGRSAINKIPLTTNQHCCCLAIDPSQANYRYVFHWVSRNYETLRDMGQGARGDLNSGLIKGFKIPIPFADDFQKSLAEQARIVSFLDMFDTLTTSITEGLPREIALREKQYAWYRDQLLSFPKPDVESA